MNSDLILFRYAMTRPGDLPVANRMDPFEAAWLAVTGLYGKLFGAKD